MNRIVRLGKHTIALMMLCAWMALCLAPAAYTMYADSHEVYSQYWPHWLNALMVLIMVPVACFGLMFAVWPYGWARERLNIL